VGFYFLTQLTVKSRFLGRSYRVSEEYTASIFKAKELAILLACYFPGSLLEAENRYSKLPQNLLNFNQTTRRHFPADNTLQR
jgi:hypothetical protein